MKKLNQPFLNLSIKHLIFIGSVLLVPIFVILLKNYSVINYIINPIGAFALIYVLYIGFKEGTEAILFIPSAMGYGATGSAPSIPPNSELVFFVNLYKVRPI